MGQLTPAQATVVASAISGLVAVIVCLVNNWATAKARKRKEIERDVKLEMWMESVDRKLDIHNGYAEIFGDVRTDISAIKTAIEFLKERG